MPKETTKTNCDNLEWANWMIENLLIKNRVLTSRPSPGEYRTRMDKYYEDRYLAALADIERIRKEEVEDKKRLRFGWRDVSTISLLVANMVLLLLCWMRSGCFVG